MADFDMDNNFTPSLAWGTNSHDHTYQVRQMQYLLYIFTLDKLHCFKLIGWQQNAVELCGIIF